jgi:hypothetical protein
MINRTKFYNNNLKESTMKTWLLSTGIMVLTALLYMGCSSSINNNITINNLSEGDVYVNFRGSVIDIASGQTSVISNIPKGSYTYSTTYNVPAGVSGSATEGNMTGTLTVNAGTKILILYSSTLLGGTYTISVSISDSDNQTQTTSPNIALPGQTERKTNLNLTGP